MTKKLPRGIAKALPFLLALIVLLALPAGLAPTAFAEDEMPADEEMPAEDEPATEEVVEDAPELPWVMDVAAAMKQAEEEGKDLFINFTGSDWCGWCMKLDEEVFSKPEFIESATQKFVFLFLDFPRSPALKAEVLDPELNSRLETEYGAEGYPTIILTTAGGAPYARTGYQPGGPEAYLEHLAELQAGGEAIKTLLDDKSREDLEALTAAMPVLSEQNFLGHPAFEWTLDAAETADPEGKLGLLEFVTKERNRRLAVEEEKGLRALMPTAGQEPDLEAIVAYVLESKHLAGPSFLSLIFNLADVHIRSEEFDIATSLLDRAARDPLSQEHPRAIELLEQFRERIAEGMAAPEDEPEDGDEPDEDDDEDEDE